MGYENSVLSSYVVAHEKQLLSAYLPRLIYNKVIFSSASNLLKPG
jgi:hypothetical protein